MSAPETSRQAPRNPLSPHAKSSPALDGFLQFALPLATFLAVLVATAVAGRAYNPGCNSGSNFLRSLAFQDELPSTCTSMPFLADIPLVILMVTCPFAWAGFRIIRRRLETLLDDLVDTGLLAPQSRNSALVAYHRSAMDRIDLNLWRRVGPRPFRALLWLGCLGLLFYARAHVSASNAMFALLAGTDDESAIAHIRAHWWVQGPLFVGIPILIGTVGVYFALRVAVAHLVLGMILLKVRRIPRGVLHYVPKWRDQNYGWSPAMRILTFFYLSTVNYTFSLVAIFYMIQDDPQTLVVAGSLATIGVISNLTIILIPFMKIIAAHRQVERQLRDDLTAQGADAMSVGRYVVAATDLITWRKIPVSSLAATGFQIVAGGYSLAQAVSAFS